MGEGILAWLFGWLSVVTPVLAVPEAVDPVVHRAFPVQGGADYGPSHHDYPATDVFADCGRAVVSPVDGVVLELARQDRWDPATNRGRDRGGRSFAVLGDDGVRYYGSHLRRLRDDLVAGDRVRAGERLGLVGHSGDARSVPCHLHFGLSPLCRGTGDWGVRRGVVAPYRFLRSWESGGELSPVDAVRAWHARHGCPARPGTDP